MARRKSELTSFTTEQMQAWYPANEAAKKLTENSHREVTPSYVQKLGALGKLRTFKISERFTLYCKEDVDAYRVETRGRKSGNAAKERYQAKQRQNSVEPEAIPA